MEKSLEIKIFKILKFSKKSKFRNFQIFIDFFEDFFFQHFLISKNIFSRDSEFWKSFFVTKITIFHPIFSYKIWMYTIEKYHLPLQVLPAHRGNTSKVKKQCFSSNQPDFYDNGFICILSVTDLSPRNVTTNENNGVRVDTLTTY